jgi:shikimate dehydrogenase
MATLLPGAIVYDLIYNPKPTLFLRQAQQHGAITIDGLEMLVQQGAAALEMWLQRSVPVDIMRQALQQHLNRQ